MFLPRSAAGLGLALVCLGLGACGLKNDPTLPPGQADSYPMVYPAGAVPSDGRPEVIFDRPNPGPGVRP